MSYDARGASWRPWRRCAHAGERAADVAAGRLRQRRPGVAFVLGQLAAQQELDVAALLGGQPGALDEQVGQRRVLASGPGGAGLGEPGRRDEVRLQGQHAEEQVAVGVHGQRAVRGRGVRGLHG
jgi:hypothetical protein